MGSSLLNYLKLLLLVQNSIFNILLQVEENNYSGNRELKACSVVKQESNLVVFLRSGRFQTLPGEAL